MGGILKNAIPEEQSPNIESESISQFRKQVLKNTELNAKRTSNSKIAHHGHGIPKDVLSMKLGEQDQLIVELIFNHVPFIQFWHRVQ